jgi:hypothetical protein
MVVIHGGAEFPVADHGLNVVNLFLLLLLLLLHWGVLLLAFVMMMMVMMGGGDDDREGGKGKWLFVWGGRGGKVFCFLCFLILWCLLRREGLLRELCVWRSVD